MGVFTGSFKQQDNICRKAQIDEMEKYIVSFDEDVTDKVQIFEKVTNIVKLGYSSFENWDAFEEAMYENLKYRNMKLLIEHNGRIDLPARDMEIYLDFRSDFTLNFGDKIKFSID